MTRLARRTAAGLAALLILAGAGQAAAGRLRKPPPTSYTLRFGDTLSAVANRFGTTVPALAQLNGIADVHKVRAGQVLRLPGVPGAPVVPVISPALARRLPDGLKTRPERLALLPAFDTAAAANKVPPDLLKALAWMESGWQNDKVSSTNAVGIGQLMPITVGFVNQMLKADLDPGVPEQNIQLSARYLAWLLRWSKGDVPKAVAGYYQGPTSVQRDGTLAETDAYVAAVVALRSRF
ncbi:MAG TPA: transglycosylase SLT domain-containing protein [Acidimicrobiales bacterium]|nr:transglycosylase SLT domain-containing protein [Acidimicrobiales bacterium]